MQFSHTNHGSGSKVSKFALVAGLHVAIGALFIHSINSRHISLSSLSEPLLVVLKPERQEPPPPPPEPPKPMPKLAPPDVFVPAPEVDVAPPPEPAPFQPTTTTEPEPSPFPSAPAEPMPQGQPAATPSTNSGRMRTAVLADGKACALPDYPARAAREGISGTTTLALLVGPDGRVSSARVEHGSGSKDLDKAAINALSLCRFKPATNNGVPEAAWATLAYVWTLD